METETPPRPAPREALFVLVTKPTDANLATAHRVLEALSQDGAVPNAEMSEAMKSAQRSKRVTIGDVVKRVPETFRARIGKRLSGAPHVTKTALFVVLPAVTVGVALSIAKFVRRPFRRR